MRPTSSLLRSFPRVCARLAAPLVAATLALCLLPAQAALRYDEAAGGDLSGDGLLPTFISVALGSNQVFGSTGGGDHDYFSILVPTGMQLSQLILLPGSSVSGGSSFLGMQAGPQVTLGPNPTSAAGLLGWIHYSNSDAGFDLFPAMSFPSFGASGFTAPLPAGRYSFWVQDTGGGTPNYGFDLLLTTAPIPEAGNTMMILAGLCMVAAVARRRL